MRRAMRILLATGFFLASMLPDGGRRAPEAQVRDTEARGLTLDRQSLAGKRFRFSWRSGEQGGVNATLRLEKDGSISGVACANESTWQVDERGRLLFRHADGRVSTVFESARIEKGMLRLEGPFLLRAGIVHVLEEVTAAAPRPGHAITPEEAARLEYSTQTFVYLDEGETVEFRLRNGGSKRIRLVSVHDHADSVVGLMRRAEVVVEVDGVRLELVCAPYVMPVETDGLRIQADTTTGWLRMPKRVQLSLWDATDPIVDTRRFVFPLPDYRLFSLGMQAYNEPVHIGERDGDPEGQRFYHNYGVDFAAFEGRQRVVSCIEGKVYRVFRDQGTILIEDDRGVILEFGHLDTILPGLERGVAVARGQDVGFVGRKGGSGNFSHLHVGVFLDRERADALRNTRNLNLYPWLIAAGVAATGDGFHAIARPHRTVRTGEVVHFDGAQSMARDAKGLTYRWRFHDGTETVGPSAEKVYDAPGQYMAALWIEDDRGRRDVDFCKVRVYTDSALEPVIPALYVSYAPTGGIRVNEPVSFRLWPQGGKARPIRLDFGDGTVLADCEPYSEVSHRFGKPGIHVVTATASFGPVPVTRSIEVRVGDAVAGAGERTPSLAHYFDWINSQYEGTDEAHTLINLEFFKWLHDEYGMKLDVYSLDVGNVDDGPFTAGVGRLIPSHCGTLESREFRRQFPRGFAPLVEKARSFGCRLGIWLGPDGFGRTPEEERARTDMMVGLCRDHDFLLFKLDAVAGGLRPEKRDALVRALEACRRFSPDLIVLDERIDLGKAARLATTSLWEGAETYIDVFMSNDVTAPHHRAGALARGRTPGLKRLIEDHGVCFSSCLDFWDDDLVLQAFNRSLIMAPQIYGSPWLLRDEEFPRLARLCNLHRRYRSILVDGRVLPEDAYGPDAVARGDGRTRILTLRNLTWNPVRYRVKLDESIGLLSRSGERAEKRTVELRRLHPSERILGRFDWGTEVEVEVLPFRACLLLAATAPIAEIGLSGCDYEVVRDVPGKAVRVRLLGPARSKAEVRLEAGGHRFGMASIDGTPAPDLVRGESITVEFPGTKPSKPWHRKLGDLVAVAVPDDAEALYEATCFAADSNALEIRSLHRAGPSRIPQVQEARRAFLEQPMFVNRGIRDRNLFDGEMGTFFIAQRQGGALRVDFGEVLDVEEIVIRIRDREERDLNPALHTFADDSVAEVSADLKAWVPLARWRGKGTIATARVPAGKRVRYLRVSGAPRRIAEVEAYGSGGLADRSAWRASNLFPPYAAHPATAAWARSFVLDEIPSGGYLAVAVPGEHGKGRAWAAIRVNGEPVGAPDRSVSFPSNTWEYTNVERGSNYTYYFPLTPAMTGAAIDVVVLGLEGGGSHLRPEVWLTAYPVPFESLELVLDAER